MCSSPRDLPSLSASRSRDLTGFPFPSRWGGNDNGGGDECRIPDGGYFGASPPATRAPAPAPPHVVGVVGGLLVPSYTGDGGFTAASPAVVREVLRAPFPFWPTRAIVCRPFHPGYNQLLASLQDKFFSRFTIREYISQYMICAASVATSFPAAMLTVLFLALLFYVLTMAEGSGLFKIQPRKWKRNIWKPCCYSEASRFCKFGKVYRVMDSVTPIKRLMYMILLLQCSFNGDFFLNQHLRDVAHNVRLMSS
ncbi:hypothetical protein GUJ93_ZPchr0010g8188 [Zizania palustris]|uniref:PRA1 family protein n=1 Tax=Zizania palustris TaxID=103762 RepID=A0A8J5SZD4_ZIZPA|nr:hypothetical protein GUJ93_ZPchr0010g8188 [Zizania palustris]